MKLNTLKIPLIGADIALICYFLPWIKIDLSALDFGDLIPNLKLVETVSGFDVAIRGNTIVLLSLLTVVAIIVICIYNDLC